MCRGGGGRGDRGQPGVRKRVEPAGASRAGHAVFVQTDNTAGNRVVAYDRVADGTLAPAGSYTTGGRGGILAGSVVDHTASQGSLAYDPRPGLLYAVNAGSDTISVFAVRGDRLALRQVLGSGGTFPVSVAVHAEHVRDPIPSLATAIGVSRATLARRFPAQVGCTPAAYLTRWRMDLAAVRLRDTDDTDDTVGVIARSLGYTSEYAFHRAFTRHRDLSPGRYRTRSRATRPFEQQ
jgi:AraC-like DNA-binding protein